MSDAPRALATDPRVVPSGAPTQAAAVLGELAAAFFGSSDPDRFLTAANELRDELPHLATDTSYRRLLEQLPAVVFMAYLDRSIGEAYVSPLIEKILGFTRAEWLDDPIRWFRQLHEGDRDRWSVEAADFFLTGAPLRSAYRVYARDGRVVWFQCEAKIERRPDGRPWFIHGVAFDVSERKRSEEKFRSFLESAPDAMLIVNRGGEIVLVNSQAEQLFGYRREELVGRAVEFLLPEAMRGAHTGHREAFARAPRARPMGVGMEVSARRKDGSEIPVEVSLAAIEFGEETLISSAIRDISQRREAEHRLINSLREKEALLKEVHHRVKNNLAVISSLFYLQSGYTQDEETLKILQESQDRIRSMARVHEMLYSSDSFAGVDFGEYARGLASQLVRSYGSADTPIELVTDFEQVHLPIELAIPCGLILTELVTNAAKHAFSEGHGGTITITVARLDDRTCALTVADDGVGMAAGLDPLTAGSLGLRLVRTLARQLDATLTIESAAPGTRSRLSFALSHESRA